MLCCTDVIYVVGQMTIQKISSDDIETFTMVTHPRRYFASSSSGLTGSVYVFARRSNSEKETQPQPSFVEYTKNDANLDTMLHDIVSKTTPGCNVYDSLEKYMSGVSEQGLAARKQKFVEVNRCTPTVNYSKDTVRKIIIKDQLMPYYRATCPSYNYAYTNYHSLNFFTSSNVPSSSVLLYASTSEIPGSGRASGSYMTTGAFSFDFYINPRYKNDSPGSDFKAGTIFHLSSTYAVSLITGSLKDLNGYVDGFRMMLQLSHSADIPPHLATHGVYPKDLVFMSDDNSLRRNHWHHVIVTWGTNKINDGTGSFYIDGNVKGTFNIPSSTIAPKQFPINGNPDVLCVGNYYEGQNKEFDAQAIFFAADPATREGLPLLTTLEYFNEPDDFFFRHPLNAEVHNLAINEFFATEDFIVSSSGNSYKDLNDTLFYLPPFFTQQSPTRSFVKDFGGVLQTPFFAVNGTTKDPFNVALSFGVDAHYMNLENFGMDLATKNFGRWLHLTASEINTTTSATLANDHFYMNPAVRKRNLTVLPCDDGNFYPNFDLIDTDKFEKYVDGIGAPDNSLINLDNLIPENVVVKTVATETGSFFQYITGPTPENYGVDPGETLTIYQRTRDPSSNEVVLFDISNLFYGNRIKPGSFSISDLSVSGSDGKIKITLRDDGYGNLYRADCHTSQSHWNSVGNVFYNEGMVLIKTPEIPFFGKDSFELEFKGEQNIHTLKFNILVNSNTLNSSSNPTYIPVSASFNSDYPDQKFCYVTNVNIHDENLNVVMKTQLVQPLVKRTTDKILLKTRMDF